jgi:predicted metal-binding protein
VLTRKTRAPVNTAVILICEKCGRKAAGKSEDNPARELQQELKHSAKDALGKKEIRPVLTSCLDICPKGQIAIAVARLSGRSARPTEFFEVDPQDIARAAEEIIDFATEQPFRRHPLPGDL